MNAKAIASLLGLLVVVLAVTYGTSHRRRSSGTNSSDAQTGPPRDANAPTASPHSKQDETAFTRAWADSIHAQLPPFEQEVAMQIRARWRKDGCLDVVTLTNLPDGVVFELGGANGGGDDGPLAIPKGRFFATSQGQKMLHERVLCDTHVWSHRCRDYALVWMTVGSAATLARRSDAHPTAELLTRQAALLGAHGELLRGYKSYVSMATGVRERSASSGFQKIDPCE